jgi:hypothetical protein
MGPDGARPSKLEVGIEINCVTVELLPLQLHDTDSYEERMSSCSG